MKSYRLNRLFNPMSKRCFDVAIDHGIFNEFGFIKGIEDIEQAVRTLVEAGPDAIQLSFGQARYLQEIPGREKPALVMRADLANAYGTQLPPTLYSRVLDDAPEQAVRLDASCIVVNLMQVPGHHEITEQCIRNILSIKGQCDRFAMPLMIEPLLFQPNARAGGYEVDGDAKKIIAMVRQAVELGADVIKADPTNDPKDYAEVVRVAGRVPVLARGGGKVSDVEVLRRTEALIRHGAAGIVYGRNIIQHANPSAITRALMAVVHKNEPPDAVAKRFGLGG